MRRLRLLGVLVLGLLSGVTARPGAVKAPERMVLGGHPVAVWRPVLKAGQKAPLVLFSHGFHGNAEQSRDLMAALAEAGYLVVAPNHQDASGPGRHASWRPAESFAHPEAWSAATYADRAQDLRDVYRALSKQPGLQNLYNPSQVALMGHSLGGYTVLGLAGAWPAWRTADLHPRAVVALSPWCEPYIEHGTLGQMHVPVMYQGGTFDLGITPTLRGPNGAYALSPEPKFFVDLQSVGHLAWTNLRTDKEALISRYTVAFLNHYVKGEPADPVLTQTLPGVARLQSDP